MKICGNIRCYPNGAYKYSREPQLTISRPSERQSGAPGGLGTFQLAAPDCSVAQRDVVLIPSLEEPLELSKGDRHRVLGTFR
ncbi:hypothetical protein Efla_005739 [Eimeria flavescens]